MWFTQSPIRIVARQKLALPGEHWGVHFGDVVVHLTRDGVRQDTFQEFLAGKEWREVRKVDPKLYPDIVRRLQEVRLNPPTYHLLDRNCEVFANWLVGERPESPQVGFFIVAAFLFACAMSAR